MKIYLHILCTTLSSLYCGTLLFGMEEKLTTMTVDLFTHELKNNDFFLPSDTTPELYIQKRLNKVQRYKRKRKTKKKDLAASNSKNSKARVA